MKAGGQGSSAMRQQQPPQGRAEDCTPLEGDVHASGGRCAAERPQGVVSALVAPWGSAAPVWSRMCPREGQGLPASPRSFLLWLVAPPLRTSPSPYHSRPRGPLALWLLLVPAGALGAETSESHCATDQSRMRAQEGLAGGGVVGRRQRASSD